MLVAGGAAISMVDGKGASARDLAQRAQDSELAAYLESELPNFAFYTNDLIPHQANNIKNLNYVADLRWRTNLEFFGIFIHDEFASLLILSGFRAILGLYFYVIANTKV
jgi:hypothetical protein